MEKVLAGIVVVQTVAMVAMVASIRKGRKNHAKLLAVLEALRIVKFESSTSQSGKGIVPRKVWDGIGTVLALTSHIDTTGVIKKKGGRNGNR